MADVSLRITDVIEMMAGYMRSRVRAEYPDIDVSDGSPFDDIFIAPMKEIFSPFVTIVNEIEIRNDTPNAAALPKAMLDELGQGSYFMVRRAGSKATGEVIFSFKSISDTLNLIIPKGVMLSTNDGYSYQVFTRLELSPLELYAMYNTTTFMYDIPVPVEALDFGEEYNVNAYRVTTVDTVFSTSLAYVKNISPMTGGASEESNEEYWDRIKSFYISRQLGTIPGYKQFIFENFPEIDEIYVSGLGDKYMTRDTIEYTDDGVNKTVTAGGKIDIYLRGGSYSSVKSQGIARNLNLLIQGAIYSTIDITGISVYRLADGPGHPKGRTVTEFSPGTGLSTQALVVVASTGISVGDTLCVSYSYSLDGGTTTLTSTETFPIKLLTIPLSCPFEDIISIRNLTQNYYVDISNNANYNITTISDLDYENTSKEEKTITITDAGRHNGDVMEVVYSYNQTINVLNNFFNIEENRIVTTDILLKEALIKYINISMVIHMGPDYTYTSDIATSLRNSAEQYFGQLTMGQSVQEPDLINALYTNENVGGAIAYINFPLQAMYVAVDPDAEISYSARVGTSPIIITTEERQYALLNKVEIEVV